MIFPPALQSAGIMGTLVGAPIVLRQSRDVSPEPSHMAYSTSQQHLHITFIRPRWMGRGQGAQATKRKNINSLRVEISDLCFVH